MLVCEGCGYSFDNSFKFCPQCWREKSDPAKVEAVILDDISDLACPLCRRVDKVEKVTEIRRHQTQSLSGTMPVPRLYTDSKGNVGSYTGRGSFNGTQVTNLAQSLEPPKRPPLPNKHGCSTWIWLGLLIWLGFFGGLDLFFFPLMNVVTDSGDPMMLIASCGGLVWLGFSILLLFLWKKKYNKENVQYQKNLNEVNRNITEWEKAIQKWELIYYCYRDGCVFIPGNNISVPVEKIIEFAYSN